MSSVLSPYIDVRFYVTSVCEVFKRLLLSCKNFLCLRWVMCVSRTKLAFFRNPRPQNSERCVRILFLDEFRAWDHVLGMLHPALPPKAPPWNYKWECAAERYNEIILLQTFSLNKWARNSLQILVQSLIFQQNEYIPPKNYFEIQNRKFIRGWPVFPSRSTLHSPLKSDRNRC